MMKKHAFLISLVAVVMVLSLSVGITWAFLKEKVENPAVNKFSENVTAVTVEEEFNGTLKKNVNVKNTGKSTAYVKVKLVTYRVNEKGDRIGGTATIPDFTAGNNWLDAGNGTYIYALPVAPNSSPEQKLVPGAGITLQKYTDDDGGVQVIEVIAESIQSAPASAVKGAWNVDVDDQGKISLKSN